MQEKGEESMALRPLERFLPSPRGTKPEPVYDLPSS